MRNLSKFALAAALAAGAAGTAIAAERTHVMSVPLPDGTVAQVHYVGDVAPRVTVVPVVRVQPVVDPEMGMPLAMPDFGRMFGDMDREMAAAMRQIDEISRQPAAAGPGGADFASFGDMAPGTTSFSSVTVSENGRQCSRSTQVIGQGAGKAPKVVSNVSGDCGPARPQQAPARPGQAPMPAVPDGPVYQS